MKNQTVTIIIPCFNENQNIKALFQQLSSISQTIKNVNLNYLFVDDGSTDNTYSEIEKICNTNKQVRAIKLSRNFGSHIAITAGIENATESDAVVIISADLQEPPELIHQLISKWQSGFEVIWAIRQKRSQSFIGKFLSRTFYKIFIKSSGLNNYPKEGPSGFFLLDKKVTQHWSEFKESNRMIIGMVVWMGFKQTSITYKQNERNSGKSSYTFMKLIKLAIDSFVSFSYTPIRFMSYIGIIISFIGFLYSLVLIYNKLFRGIGPTGWTSLMVIVLIIGGLQLIMLGILGEYIWRGVDETRNRPLYLITERKNFTGTTE